MKLRLIYQNHVDFNYQTVLCASQNCIADSAHVSQYKGTIYAHATSVSLIMFNNITEPNQIVVIDLINHFNQDGICQLSHDVSGCKDLI